jgi:hypothetical protein
MDTFIAKVRKNITLTIAFTLILYVTAQFIVMATVATRGADIGDIRREQEQIRLENEQLRSEINGLRTVSEIMEDVATRYAVQQVKPQVLAEH